MMRRNDYHDNQQCIDALKRLVNAIKKLDELKCLLGVGSAMSQQITHHQLSRMLCGFRRLVTHSVQPNPDSAFEIIDDELSYLRHNMLKMKDELRHQLAQADPSLSRTGFFQSVNNEAINKINQMVDYWQTFANWATVVSVNKSPSIAEL